MTHDLLTQFTLAQQMLQGGLVEEALRELKRLHKTYPKEPEIMLQLALVHRQRKEWNEAIALMRKAVALGPHMPHYTEHLAMVLMYSNEGRNIVESVSHYANILQHNPQYEAVGTNLLILALRNDMPRAVRAALEPALAHPQPDTARLHYSAACAIATYLLNDIAACKTHIANALTLKHVTYGADGKIVHNDLHFMVIYVEFLRDLLAFRASHPALYHTDVSCTPLHVIGESHCLTPMQLVIEKGDQRWRVQSHIIVGAKAYAFTQDHFNAWNYALQEIIRKTEKYAPIIVGFGELDCRPTEGLMAQHREHTDYNMNVAIDELVGRYVRFVHAAQKKRKGPCYIAGVPAPTRVALRDLKAGEEQLFTAMIRYFNEALAREAASQSLGFIDFYTETLGEGGLAKEGMHLDHVHLTPAVAAQAMARALTPEHHSSKQAV